MGIFAENKNRQCFLYCVWQPTTSVLGYRVLWIYRLPRVGQLDNIVELFPDKISSKIRVGGWGFIGYLVDARRGGFIFVKGTEAW